MCVYICVIYSLYNTFQFTCVKVSFSFNSLEPIYGRRWPSHSFVEWMRKLWYIWALLSFWSITGIHMHVWDPWSWLGARSEHITWLWSHNNHIFVSSVPLSLPWDYLNKKSKPWSSSFSTFGMVGIRSGSATCKTNVLSTVLSFWPQIIKVSHACYRRGMSSKGSKAHQMEIVEMELYSTAVRKFVMHVADLGSIPKTLYGTQTHQKWSLSLDPGATDYTIGSAPSIPTEREGT